jgi:hypothetical protein
VVPTLTEEDGVYRVRSGALDASVDAATGSLRRVAVASKVLVDSNAAAPMAAELLQDPAFDPSVDSSGGTVLNATWEPGGFGAVQGEGTVEIRGSGRLVFDGGDSLDVGLVYVFGGGRHVRVGVSLSPRGSFRDRYIRSVGFCQPLSLSERKRVVLAGDQGLRWDVRHRYQFHTHVRFLPEPDQNWWRRFFVDQESGHSYTIWRSEASDTAPLVDFRGRRAAGWMCAYDRDGGALFAYRALAEHAPKALYIDAAGGGAGTVFLHSPTHAALAPAAPLAVQSLFAPEHEIDWIFFAGEEAFEQPDRELAEAWGVESLPSDGPNRFEPVADTGSLFDTDAAPAGFSPMVQGGVPIPRGALRSVRNVRLFVDDREHSVTARPLAYWPDTSIKWLLLIFAPGDVAEGGAGTGEGDSVEFRVTRRRGGDIPCRLVFGADVVGAALRREVSVVRTGDTVRVDTGPLALVLGTGPQWLRQAVLDGRDLVRRDSGEAQAFVNFLRPQSYVCGTTHAGGRADPGPVQITGIDVEESDGLRAVVRLEGIARCQEPARVIIRLEAWAGRPFVRLFHTVEFLHSDPRDALVRHLGLRLPVALGGEAEVRAGGPAGVVRVAAADSAGLRQSSHLNSVVWRRDAGVAWCETVQSGDRSRGWLDVADDSGGLCTIQRDMWQEAPKELRYDWRSADLTVGYWPRSAPPMDCRRYSNYPHRAQGESAPADVRWVLDDWYAKDPIKGISRTHETILFFHGPVSPEVLEAVAADFQRRPIVTASWDTYTRTGVVLPLNGVDDPAFAGVNANMEHVADWWLFHQRAWGWYGFWDYGDVQHRFRSGYGRIFAPEVLRRILALPAERRSEVAPSSEFPAHQDYFTQNDWAYDNGRWGWSNTEGLVNHFMSQMFLRTGRRDLFFFVEANARHVRDVDARHAGMWFGRGTRHGVQHWSDGNHEERQTTFTEQRYHYLLTGEFRTREWNRVLTEDYYLKGVCSVHANHSGRTYGLLTNWEMTGDPGMGRILRDYMRALSTPEGIGISTAVEFPAAVRVGEPVQVNGESMFFHTFGGMHALLEYYELTGDSVVREALIATADAALRGGSRSVGGMLRKAVAFAARYAPDPGPYGQALADAVSGPLARYAFQQVTANPTHWTGPTAFLQGNVSGGLFWANDALYVFGALDREPLLSEDMQEDFRKRETQPAAAGLPIPQGRWQDEYDLPEFREYLRDRLAR